MTDANPAAPVAPIPLVLPLASFTNLASVLRSVPLRFPVTLEGRDWQAICIRRLSVEQIAAIMENFRANLALDPAAPMRLPIFVDAAGLEIPDGLLGRLDADDRDTLDEAANDFLPRRFRAGTAPDGSAAAPATGAATSPSAPA